MIRLGLYISVLGLSMIKFFLGAPAGLMGNLLFMETFVCMVVGMMLTVTIITFGGGLVLDRFKINTKKKFSKYSRFSVKVWNLLGIWGIALLTPPLFTPIGGTLIALSFKVNSFKIITTMLISAIIWGILICTVAYSAKDLFLSIFHH